MQILPRPVQVKIKQILSSKQRITKNYKQRITSKELQSNQQLITSMGSDEEYICLTTATIKITKLKQRNKKVNFLNNFTPDLQLIVGVKKAKQYHFCSFGLTI